MSIQRNLLFVTIVCIAALGIPNANASRITNLLGPSSLSTYTPSGGNLGSYYVVKFSLPPELDDHDLDWAFLEFFLDAASFEKGGYASKSPMLEVYALSSQFAGAINPANFKPQTIPSARNVTLGQNRRILIDITEIVRGYMQNPTKNHGLIIGSLTGRRDGNFSLKNNQLQGNAVARVIFHYDSIR